MSLAPSTAMMMSSLLGAGGDAVSAISGSNAYRMQGEAEQQAMEFNARMSELKAQDTLDRGDFQAKRIAQAGRATVSAQKVAAAAQGIQADTGSAADVQLDTRALAEQDIQQAKINAWRESWGLKAEAEQLRQRGRGARMAGENQAANTMLVGGIKVLGGGIRAYGDYASGLKPGISDSAERSWQQRAANARAGRS